MSRFFRTSGILKTAVLGLSVIATSIAPKSAEAQARVDTSILQIQNTGQCAALMRRISRSESGGQWLIGDDISLYGLSNVSAQSINRLTNSFQPVRCFGEEQNRVFVATADDSACGWVDKSDLLEDNQSVTRVFESQERPVCETPRAMLFKDFCTTLTNLSDEADAACVGVPSGLRAKGVLTGSTSQAEGARYTFMTAPKGGAEIGKQTFFSVLEIHDIAPGDASNVMVLVGDGEGTMLGWIDLRAVELWPTRLGLFYDAKGQGVMFQRYRDLVRHWRGGNNTPDITSGMTLPELRDYVHGPLQLLSYPIVRTVDPIKDVTLDPNAAPYHEVIFLGQTGEGSASQLLAEAEFANRVETLQRVNIMIVIDTTESMRKYLPLLRSGISKFISEYGQLSQNAANQLPDIRLAVYAYSDFLKASATKMNDPIRIETLMPPSRVGLEYDVSRYLQRISAHKGLDDAVGLREEAALEAVAQLSGTFSEGRAWYESGPRVIIHMGDHGSRKGVSVARVLRQLRANNTYYLPVAVLTKDETASSKRAREAFMKQSMGMLAPLVDGAVSQRDVSQVDLIGFESKTAQVISDQLNLVMSEVVQAVQSQRSALVNGPDSVADSSRLAQDRASSRIKLDEGLVGDLNLDELRRETVVEAATAFAPLSLKINNAATDIDWTYTVALEPVQARFLRTNFEAMCQMVGNPEQGDAFRRLIVRVAEVFSGDRVNDSEQVRAILSDMKNLPGADRSFLSQQPNILLQRADSTDPAVIAELRRDVCWISYHLSNMGAGIYAQPKQLVWSGREYTLKAGEQVKQREYRYKPVVGAETMYLPSFFFVLPSVVEHNEAQQGDDVCDFFCN